MILKIEYLNTHLCLLEPSKVPSESGAWTFGYNLARFLTKMASKGPAGDWYKNANNIKGLLIDIFGVLYDSGDTGDVAIPGSVEAVKKLKAEGVPVRFCSNSSTDTKAGLAERVRKLGFPIENHEIFSPPPAVVHFLKQNNLRPFLVVSPGVVPDFSEVDQSNPNCVVLGDAQHEFSFKNVNRAFQILFDLEKPVLISMGAGMYYKETDGMKLDGGAYMKALEHACDLKAEVIGKPAASFFMAALNDIGVKPEEAVMIGDDIVSDVGGAQACGIRGVQVRTGKYRPNFEPHGTVKPNGYVDNLLQGVELYLQHR